jgi:hypothetical protein
VTGGVVGVGCWRRCVVCRCASSMLFAIKFHDRDKQTGKSLGEIASFVLLVVSGPGHREDVRRRASELRTEGNLYKVHVSENSVHTSRRRQLSKMCWPKYVTKVGAKYIDGDDNLWRIREIE